MSLFWADSTPYVQLSLEDITMLYISDILKSRPTETQASLL